MKYPFTFILIAFFGLTSQAQVDSTLATALQNQINDFIVTQDFKGISAAVMFPDGSLWTGTTGESYPGQPVTEDMLFGIGSITKTFTATTVLSMYEDGLLSLDDSLHSYLPNFDNIDSNITIRQLLNHTSGIYNWSDHPNFRDWILANLSRILEPEEVLEQFVDAPYFSPGSNYHYSNSNYLLLGMIVERVSGNLLSQEYITRIFNPAGLDSTFLDIEQTHYNLYAHMWYDLDENGTIEDLDLMGIPRDAYWSMAWAAGAIVTTASQLVKFSHALLHEQSILSPSTLSEMTDFSATNGRYGFAIFPYVSSCENWIGHDGLIIYQSIWAFSPKGISIVILHNQEVGSVILIREMDAMCQLIKNFTTSIDDLKYFDSSITLYPNPAQEVLNISLSKDHQDVDIQIYSVLGKLEKNYHLSGSKLKLDISELNAGIHLVKTTLNGVCVVSKLIVQ